MLTLKELLADIEKRFRPVDGVERRYIYLRVAEWDLLKNNAGSIGIYTQQHLKDEIVKQLLMLKRWTAISHTPYRYLGHTPDPSGMWISVEDVNKIIAQLNKG